MQILPMQTYTNQNSQPLSNVKINKTQNMQKDVVSFGAKCNFSPEFEKYVSKWLKKNKFSRNEWNDKILNKEIIDELKKDIKNSAEKIDDISIIEIGRTPLKGFKNLFNRSFTLKTISEGNTLVNKTNTYEIEIPVNDPKTVLNQVFLEIESIHNDFSKIPEMQDVADKIEKMLAQEGHSEEFIDIANSFKAMIKGKK